MKLPIPPFAALLSLPLLLCASLSANNGSSGEPASELQIRVDVPPAWDVFLEDDIARVIVGRVRDSFRRQGFEGEITRIDRGDEIRKKIPFLELRLFEWRVGRTGMVQCTMSASYTSEAGETRSLGMLSATEFTWGSRNRWRLQESFLDAVDTVARQLWRELERAGIAPAQDDS